MLRCFQVGITLADLEVLSMGTVFDIITEAGNDNYNYQEVACQEDFDKF